MATTEPATQPDSEELERYSERHVVPVLVLEISDERSRSRWREAVLISIIFHILLIHDAIPRIPFLLKYTSDKQVKVWTAQELINRDRELTYLAMPRDSQQVTKRPNTDIISDKDRIAMSRHPTLDEKTLRELRDSLMRQPGPTAPPSPAPEAQATPASRPSQPNQMARLEPPASAANVPNVFAKMPLSAGSAIEQAARESAARRASGMGGGDYGAIGSGRGAQVQGGMEILSDTLGVDFAPYMARLQQVIYKNWYLVMPESALPPLLKKGKVSIQFVILKDGSVTGMRLVGSSNDAALDRGAWGAITTSNPFPPLPTDFGGPYLEVRGHFYYNPDRGDLLR